MNKVLRAIVTGLTIIGLTASCTKAKFDIFKESAPSAVRILTPEGRAHGSGFLLLTPKGKKVIITNEHVCEGMKEIRVRFPGVGDLDAMSFALYQDSKVDLCVIGIPQEFQDIVRTLPLAPNFLLRGKVFAIGYPLEYPLSLSQGYGLDRAIVQIASLSNKCEKPIPTMFGWVCLKEMHVVVTNTTIYPGNSGSAALNEDGEVVGVFNSASSVTNYGNMISLEDLKNFISEF